PWPPLNYCERKGIEPRWYRPGPEFQARALGQWPDSGSGVWGPALWEACVDPARPEPPFPGDELPQVGIDCSTGKGDDVGSLVGRWGAVAVHAEESNTMRPVRTVERAVALCGNLAALVNSRSDPNAARCRPEEICVKVDDDGVGNAVVDMLREKGYFAVL